MTTSSSGALSGERRVVTALFCDVVGSTAIAETMDPEDWGELVGEAIATMGTVVARFGGTVTEFGGDAVVALFGAPTAHEDDPYRAVRTGLEIVREIRQSAATHEHPLDVRVGIHTGLVVVGDIDAGALSTYSALGDTLNVAARLQTIADTGTVVISADTRRLLGDDVEVRGLGPTELKGRSSTIVVYEVIGAKGTDERTRGLPGLTSPMVGRSAELESLRRLVASSAAGTGRVAVVLGEPGVGKSRLLEELEHELPSGVAPLWAMGRCVPFDEELPYHLLASLIRSQAGVGSSETPEVVAKAIDSLAEGVGRSEHGTVLRRLVGIEGEYEDVSAEALGGQYARALLDVTSGLAVDAAPVVLICEDAHWADPSSVELMSELMASVPTMPVLLLIAMRPDRGAAGWGLLETARRELAETLTEIHLTSLDESDSRALVSNLLEVESLPPTVRGMVMEKAEGNPFFLEEVVRMLIERDLVENREGRWIARPGVDNLEVPETIQGLLASRVDMLEPEVRQAGRVAAVIGRQFSASLFRTIYETSDDVASGLHPHLASLEARGMIQLAATSPEVEFGFRHALIHDVMYEGLLKRERRELHRSVAEALESSFPGRLDELAPALARHLTVAGENTRAVGYLFVAAGSALARGARVEAARFFGHAQRLLENDPAAEPEKRIDAVIGRLRAGRQFTPAPEALGWIDSVLSIAKEVDDPDRLAALYERSVWTRSMQGDTYASPEYREELDAGYALVDRLSDPGVAGLIEAMMGGAMRAGDEYEESLEPLALAVDGLEAAGRLAEASFNAGMLADSLSQIGRFDEAMAAVGRAADLAEASGDPNATLDADIIRGSIAGDRGEFEEALEYTRRGIAGAEAVGNTFCDLAGNFKLADQQLRLGNVDTAINHLERSTGLAEYCNAGGYEALGQAWLANARARMGELRLEDFEAPLAAAIGTGSRSGEGLVRMQRAFAVAGVGDPEGSFDDFERAIALFAAYGGLPNLARARHAYGEALEAAGKHEESVDQLQKAQALFEELKITPDPVSG